MELAAYHRRQAQALRAMAYSATDPITAGDLRRMADNEIRLAEEIEARKPPPPAETVGLN